MLTNSLLLLKINLLRLFKKIHLLGEEEGAISVNGGSKMLTRLGRGKRDVGTIIICHKIILIWLSVKRLLVLQLRLLVLQSVLMTEHCHYILRMIQRHSISMLAVRRRLRTP